MFSYVGLVTGLLKAVAALTAFFHDQGLIKAGEAQAVAAGLTATLDEIGKAQAARQKSDDDFDNNPATQLEDDGFERKD